MTKSYNEILNDMRNDYFNRCGKRVDMNSEVGARMQSVASEVFSLFCYADFVLKQAFPQTATSKYLERHAELRDINRKKALKASGILRFFCSEGCTENVKLPKGIVCSVKSNPYLQFITVEEKEIIPGAINYVDVKAESINTGYENNVKQNTITAIVNPPLNIVGVNNNEAFSGGLDEETDSFLRRRILNSYDVTPNGFNEQSLVDAVLTIDDVRDCIIRALYTNTIEVCVETYSNSLTKKLVDEINEKLFIKNLFSGDIDVVLAVPREYTLCVEIYKNYKINENLDNQVKDTINEVANSISIQEDIKLGEFTSALSCIDGVKYCDVSSDSAIGGIIYANERESLKLKSNGVKVIYYD